MKSAEKKDSFLRGPKYQWVAERLRSDIARGVWPVGAQLPVERELARTLDVSINTVRRAVGELVADGTVQRRQGAGTFVCPRPGSAPAPRRLVGVLVPSTTYYYPRVVEGIRQVLRDAGVSVLLASSEYDLDTERDELRALRETDVDGLLLVPNLHLMPDPQDYLDDLRRLPVPYVLVERRPPRPAPDDPTPYVRTDHAGGVCLALRHLHTLGHRRIGQLGRLSTGTADLVADGFDRAAELLGVTVPSGAVARRRVWTPEDMAGYVRQCADTGVTAVFCLGDRDAAALVVEARRQGLRVPRDLAVVAYDDEVAEIGDLPLTAVSPPKEEIGVLAARMLLSRMDAGPGAPAQRVELLPRLVVRASCGGVREPRPAPAVPVSP
ncbi:LacI family DNA-binding transcriptional regulator [Streptomyces sp. NPDC003832]